MNYLSLFSGVEGGGLALQHLIEPKLQCIGYVEIDDYCQRIIQQRIIDGFLDRAPIFGDVKAFISEGYAEAYKNMVDVLSAGFPCQPFSVAGKQKGEQDERNLWPETRDTISIIRPRYVFLENVSGLLATIKQTLYRLLRFGQIWGVEGFKIERTPYAGRVQSDLAEMGYDCKWGIVAAQDVSAPHLRDRWWVMAHAKSL